MTAIKLSLRASKKIEYEAAEVIEEFSRWEERFVSCAEERREEDTEGS